MEEPEQQPEASGRTILLVHGRDFKPSPDTLRAICTEAIRAGIERDYPDRVDEFDAVRIELAYYGDLANDLLTGSGERYDEELDVGDRRNALSTLRAVEARKRFGIRQYDRLPGKSALREFVADMAAPALGALGLTRWLIGRVSRDCAEYLAEGSRYATRVRKRVRKKLCEVLENDGRVLLMSHGMGCVVAYEALWELSHLPEYRQRYGKAKIDLWVTLGAPLGDRFIRRRLLSARDGSATPFPTNVITWQNVAAEDDYTCHDNTLADDFKKMMDQRLVSAVHDYHIYNLAVRYGRSNPHSSVGYFIHPRVAKIVVDWMSAPGD